jgi:methenyltetrahydrofolate cyclohydrolase
MVSSTAVVYLRGMPDRLEPALLERDARGLLDLFAQPLASPAAGSAAALAGALAAALAGKVALLSAAGEGGFAPRAREIAAAAERLRAVLQSEVEADGPVFGEVMRRRAERDAATDPENPETRAELARRAVEALRPAIAGPLRVARAALEVGRLAAELCERGRRSARGDAGTALALARAAAESALLLTAENLRPARSAAWSTELQGEADTLLAELAEAARAPGAI